MSVVEVFATAWPADPLRKERFLSKTIEREEPDAPPRVKFAESSQSVQLEAEDTILKVAEDCGLPVFSSCKTGTCGT